MASDPSEEAKQAHQEGIQESPEKSKDAAHRSKSMRLLFLDDCETRHLTAAKAVVAHNRTYPYKRIEVYHARAASQAISLLEGYHFDAASLDYDLSCDTYLAAPNGLAVAKWIAEHLTPRHVAIHSWNSKGSDVMCNMLPKAIRRPFAKQGFSEWLDVVSRLNFREENGIGTEQNGTSNFYNPNTDNGLTDLELENWNSLQRLGASKTRCGGK